MPLAVYRHFFMTERKNNHYSETHKKNRLKIWRLQLLFVTLHAV